MEWHFYIFTGWVLVTNKMRLLYYSFGRLLRRYLGTDTLHMYRVFPVFLFEQI